MKRHFQTGSHKARRHFFVRLMPASLVLAIVAFVFFRSPPPQRTGEVEATITELVRREGLLYRPNEPHPFTGYLVERYPSGALKSRSAIQDGLLHGISIGWHTNGQMEVREQFISGVSDGLRTKWYSDGNPLSESTIRKGAHHGTFRRWHENGQIAEQVEMNAGKPDGLSMAWYPSGFLKARTRLVNGQPAQQEFWKDGEAPALAAAEGNVRP
ncbi:MAG: hypothetical protein AB1813_09575 [Verrucomicrobiota bacterium]